MRVLGGKLFMAFQLQTGRKIQYLNRREMRVLGLRRGGGGGRYTYV